MDIVRPEEILPELDIRARAVAEKISACVRKQKDKFNGHKVSISTASRQRSASTTSPRSGTQTSIRSAT